MKDNLYYPSTIMRASQTDPNFSRMFGPESELDPPKYVGIILVYESKADLRHDWPMCRNITKIQAIRTIKQ